MEKFTIAQFNRMFPDEATCLDTIKNLIYPSGIECRECKKVTTHHKLTNRKAYSCDHCGTHVYPLAGTIFEKSSTPLKSWFYAMYLMASTRCGISAKQLERELGVTYKTAWRMFTQIRKLLTDDGSSLGGIVEVDETYIGGKREGGKRGRGSENKTVVMGMMERKGRVKALVVPNVKARTLVSNIIAHVVPASAVFTDDLPSYNRLRQHGLEHDSVAHSKGTYVIGADIHINTIEGFWSQLKRSIDGTYHHVSSKYLPLYINEYSFRYNHRQEKRSMYEALMGQIGAVRGGRYGEYAPIGS